jgi:hypothetical protein
MSAPASSNLSSSNSLLKKQAPYENVSAEEQEKKIVQWLPAFLEKALKKLKFLQQITTFFGQMFLINGLEKVLNHN